MENFVGERTGFTTLLLYLPQYPFLLWPLGFVLWGLVKRRGTTLAAGALGLCFCSYFLLDLRVALPKGSDQKTGTLRLMSYNIERGNLGLDQIEVAIRAQKPDFVCLQESQGIYQNHAFVPGGRLAARFVGWNVAQSGDVMTLSPFPLVAHRDFPLRGTRRVLDTTWQTPRGPLRVLNVHIATSYAGSQYPRAGFINRALQVIHSAKPSAQARIEQIAPLSRAIEAGEQQTPLIMTGDFNSPPHGLFYRAISHGFSDAWNEGGRGIPFTYPSRFPLLPIDHALVRGVEVENAFVPDAGASDHRPLVVDLKLEK